MIRLEAAGKCWKKMLENVGRCCKLVTIPPSARARKAEWSVRSASAAPKWPRPETRPRLAGWGGGYRRRPVRWFRRRAQRALRGSSHRAMESLAPGRHQVVNINVARICLLPITQPSPNTKCLLGRRDYLILYAYRHLKAGVRSDEQPKAP